MARTEEDKDVDLGQVRLYTTVTISAEAPVLGWSLTDTMHMLLTACRPLKNWQSKPVSINVYTCST